MENRVFLCQIPKVMTIMETQKAIFSYASYLKRVKELLTAGKVTAWLGQIDDMAAADKS